MKSLALETAVHLFLALPIHKHPLKWTCRVELNDPPALLKLYDVLMPRNRRLLSKLDEHSWRKVLITDKTRNSKMYRMQ